MNNYNGRSLLIRRLEQDLVGPLEKEEVLRNGRPADVYLTGILWPIREELGAEELDRLDSGAPSEDETAGSGEEAPLIGQKRPCSAGLSFSVESPDSDFVDILVRFAMYELLTVDGASAWRRRSHEVRFNDLQLPRDTYERRAVASEHLPEGLDLYLRTVSARRADGTSFRLATATLINGSRPESRDRDAIELNTLFQVGIVVSGARATRLVPKPDMQSHESDEEKSGSLMYRDCPVFAVGHTCSAEWHATEGSTTAEQVRTTWLPRYEVPRVSAAGHACFKPLSSDSTMRCLEASWLAEAPKDKLNQALRLLVSCYDEWIEIQAGVAAALPQEHQGAAKRHLSTCRETRDRLIRGIDATLTDPWMLESFRLANMAMQRQNEWNTDRGRDGPLKWRPFQLAFILLAGPPACDSKAPDRELMDLLWFPTGGGKTEAYLGIIAMLAFYRRLSEPAPDSRAGVAAVMRYTLRLLTTQQFVRASALILACESLRRGNGLETSVTSRLGKTPFSIGLWLGGDATPNTYEAAAKAMGPGGEGSSPVQLVTCPCCHKKLRWQKNAAMARIEAACNNTLCELGKSGPILPIVTVDTDVYSARPTLLIGTVDKFAQLPRKEEVKALFGFGGGDSPDLVIQDELHLISGPLGTVVGLYEIAFDWLTIRGGHRAKIIGSTATIRRAGDQGRALFDRDVAQFPPPGLDHLDSGFAVRDPDAAGRLYVGVSTVGRSAKFALQSVSGCLLQAAAGEIQDDIARDPYETLVAYFNSLRELGGALVLMQDDVADSMQLYARRHGESVRTADNIEELTSRRSQEEVRDMLDKLAIKAGKAGCVDAVLATNMLSVGVDIPRLGLMLVNGQPKTRSEYIQATSRVGRDKAPGLVVAMLNSAKPRDRSHFETFPAWHQALYRDVEATSVTPFASRARDRGLKGVLVTMLRHSIDSLSSSPLSMNPGAPAVMAVVDEIVRRGASVDPAEKAVRKEMQRALLQWEARKPEAYWRDQQPGRSLLQSAERAAALKAMGRVPGAAWPTLNNMRSVEASVPFKLREKLGAGPTSGPAGGGDGDE